MFDNEAVRGKEMPYLTQNDIEAIAQRVTAAYRKLPGLCGTPITKVDPVRLATELLDLLELDYLDSP